MGILSHPLSNSAYGFLGNDFNNGCFKTEKDSLQGYFGVPLGCTVRNTFLEWQEPEDTIPSELSRVGLPAPGEQPPSETKPRRRTRSCPREFMSRTSRSFAQEEQHGDDERCQPTLGRASTFTFTSNGALATPASLSSDDAHERSTATDVDSQHSEDHIQQKTNNNRADGPPVILRGLPFTATVADVMDLITQAGCAHALARHDPITLLSNGKGRPSGFAEVQLNHPNDFWEVKEKLHMQRLGNRYVEALPPRGKGGWGASPASRQTARRDPWWKPKGQAAGSSARGHQSCALSPELAYYKY
mmetsp:Transcript_24987/g.63359  ORF Transcript_24987/g.63359 Transcript_24987/m.63359 type:complete len:302 (-) Transcript_24987:344-1249(-)